MGLASWLVVHGGTHHSLLSRFNFVHRIFLLYKLSGRLVVGALLFLLIKGALVATYHLELGDCLRVEVGIVHWSLVVNFLLRVSNSS